MTVCLASIAADDTTLVCVADKALSIEGVITWDSDAAKMITLGQKKAIALTAGTETEISRVVSAIRDFDGYAEERSQIIKHLERQFKDCFWELQQAKILDPINMTRKEFVKATSGERMNDFVLDLATKMQAFMFDCEIVVCGLDSSKLPYIFLVRPPGVVTDCTNIGCHAIGTGAPKAISRLLFNGHERKDGVARTLYDCFDAKANAEMEPDVGFDWDAMLITGGGVVAVTKHVKPLMNSVWFKFNRSPFEFDKRKKDDPPDPPDDWEMLLRECVDASLKDHEPNLPVDWKVAD